jgi:hypothetical protein
MALAIYAACASGLILLALWLTSTVLGQTVFSRCFEMQGAGTDDIASFFDEKSDSDEPPPLSFEASLSR